MKFGNGRKRQREVICQISSSIICERHDQSCEYHADWSRNEDTRV